MLSLRHSDYEITPIVHKLYPSLLGPCGEKYLKAKLILPGHLHDVDSYPSNADHDPEKQHDKSASPCNGGLSAPPRVKPNVDWITICSVPAHDKME